MPMPGIRDESQPRATAIRELAERHLPPAAAEEFVGWLRPALRLEQAREGEVVVARLGGLPMIAALEWPVWDDHGPLSHVLTLDCALVRDLLPEEPSVPATGRLGFFYYDGRYRDDVETTVGSWDASTHAGARVLRMPDEVDAPAAAPPELEPYPAIDLTAVRTVTWPSGELPWVEEAWERHGLREGASDPVDELYDALGDLPDAGGDTHQLGGHAAPQQGAVELEVEQFRRGVEGAPFAWSDPDVRASTTRWRLLLQVASDDAADMMWGDVGQLYWLTRDADPPTEAFFTWQCA